MKVVLVEPEIPPNTGNIARLCAGFGIELNLVEPLGFSLEDRYLKRAGCDYWPHVNLKIWKNWEDFYQGNFNKDKERLIMATTKATRILPEFFFMPTDILLFGSETRGLPADILSLSALWIKVPTIPIECGGIRSLNLSTTVGIVLYTAMAFCHLPPVYQ